MALSLSLCFLSAAVSGLVCALVLQPLCFPYFWRDLLFLLKVVRSGVKLELYRWRRDVRTVLDRFVEQARRIPDKPFIIYDGSARTYRDVDRRSERLARVFLNTAELKKGDCVAMLMNNEPDYLCVWFGLAKVGCTVAFLNTNIRSKSVLHCLDCCGARTLIVGSDLLECLESILLDLQQKNIQVWTMKSHMKHTLVRSLLDQLDIESDDRVPAELRATTAIDTPMMYIFTSGTTGLPKAAVITHLQSLKAASGFWAFGATESDVIYTALPLYHSAASLVGIGGTIELGATCVLKKKFSASQFWPDCRNHGVTIFQYIGELCRYLCNQPKTEMDQAHKVRMGVGNGLRQDVWRDFLFRFGNIKMCEIYGSTEGNLCFMNHIGKIGAVGRSNVFYKLLFKYDLVKYDMIKDEPVRDQHGFCQPVKKGETGLLLSRVSAISPFFGYAGNKRLTEKKLLRNVLVKGDAYFNTGDLMAEDQEGFIYFRDRVGDTFRWKGENVATTEVAEVLGSVDFVQEVNVYGVEIPGREGRAGMAALIVRPCFLFDGEKLFECAVKDLPAYARPVFVRLQDIMEMTSTFKQQKFQLVQSGFNPSTISDPLYVLDYHQRSYTPLTEQIHQSVLSGEWKM
ncbi:Long-chain fatty acid transport protein 6 [Oryzias melastigma]|uniref:long-chain-fatty-acid--CoA ligase n=1 Tax=Oryzias melastigma TaxID=30732 RepID=A0A834CBB8_ORYME|nr:Long-chain fatty acid transport protein 6 [Oryzias melastigma]